MNCNLARALLHSICVNDRDYLTTLTHSRLQVKHKTDARQSSRKVDYKVLLL